ncbi:MAG: hypothetical protein R3F65_03465 [bacterium]
MALSLIDDVFGDGQAGGAEALFGEDLVEGEEARGDAAQPVWQDAHVVEQALDAAVFAVGAMERVARRRRLPCSTRR